MTSPLDHTITLDRALELIEARRIPLAPEVAGYLCLELAERASMQPGNLVAQGVFLGEEGAVAFVPRADGESPEPFVRKLLRRLLEASGARPPALWQVSTDPTNPRARPGLEGLVRELEAALIPLNRMASRRSLARLAREVRRVTHGVGRNAPSSVRPPPASTERAPDSTKVEGATSLPPPSMPPPREKSRTESARAEPSRTEKTRAEKTPRPAEASVRPSQAPSTIDALLDALDPQPNAPSAAPDPTTTRNELKAMAGLEPTPPPPIAHIHEDDVEEPTHEESEAIEQLLLSAASAPQSRLAEAMRPSRPDLHTLAAEDGEAGDAPRTVIREGANTTTEATDIDTADELEPHSETKTRESPEPPEPEPRIAKSPLRRITPDDLRVPPARGAGRTLAVALLFAFALGLGLVYWLRPEWMLGHKLTPTPAPSASTPPPPEPVCALRVLGVPAEAEVLVRSGVAPLDVSPMPAGARIEFIGMLPGHAPKRAVIPAQATWSKDERGRPRYELAFELAPSHKKADPWPAAEPGTTVGGEGEPGTVHLVSNPPGAEVWLLFGSGPEAALDPVPCADTEVLVAAGTQLRTRLSIAASEFAAKPGEKAVVSKDLRGGR